MRKLSSLVLLLAASCGTSNNAAHDGAGVDGVVIGDGSGSGSAGLLTITLTDKPAVLGNVAAVTFGFATSIPATTECRVDGDAYAACTSPDTVPALIDGMHSFDVRATAGGQQAAVPTYSFTVDTVAPALMITGQPANPSPVTTAQFHFTTDDALSTSVMCQLDTQAAAACTSPVSYAGLADGSHTFTLTGSDGAGNAATKTYTWTVDTAAPTLTITSEPPDPYASTSAHFEFTIGTSSTVSCQLDSLAATACASPIDYAGLTEGAHTFTLRGTNASGMTTTVTYTWHVDTIPPGATITSGPATNTSSTTAQLAFTTSGAATITCQLDSGTAAACTSPWTYMSLADGAHVFTLKAVDAAGNSTTKTYSWTVDTVPPVVTITSSPGNPSTTASATFAFTVTGATSTTCKIDSASATNCTTSASYSALSEGNHTFTVTATDAASNVTTKSFMWLVDTVAPALAITSAPSGPTNSANAHIAFTAGADAVSVTCQLDSTAATACSGSVDYTGLAEGAHSFTVRASDAAGNTAVKTAAWSVDTVAPTLAITSFPNSLTNSTSATFTFNESGASTVTCQIDAAAAASCASPATYSGLGDGMHTFTVTASDAAGNVTTKTYSWTIDATRPMVTFTTVPPNPTKSATAQFAWSVSETSTQTCQIGSGSPFPCSSPYTTPSLMDNSYTFTVYATDAAGNTGNAVHTWTIDTTAPVVHIYTTATATTHSPSFSYTVSEGGTTNTYVFDLLQADAQSGAAGDPLTLSGVADGTHTVWIYATDAAGNQGNDSQTWTTDTTAPSVSVSYSCANYSVTWNWSASDANGISGNSCTCTVNGPGGGTFACAPSGTAAYNNVQNTSFSETCSDIYGNPKTVTKTMTSAQITFCANNP